MQSNVLHIRIAVVISLLVGFNACAPYKYSYKLKEEKLALNLTETQDKFEMEELYADAFKRLEEKNNPALALNRGKGRMPGFIQPVITGAIMFTKWLIESNVKKYIAEYEFATDQHAFYNDISTLGPYDPNGIKFRGFTFIRSFKHKKKDVMLDTALYLRVVIDRSDSGVFDIYHNSTFKLCVDSFALDFSKAKVDDRRWYLPWTLSRKKDATYVDVNIEITVKASWVSNEGHIYRNQVLGVFQLPLFDVPLDKTQPGATDYFKKLKGIKLDGKSFLIPRSPCVFYDIETRDYKTCYGTGDFSLHLKIMEIGNRGKFKEIIENNLDKIPTSM